MNYDIIGDVHGHFDKLVALLKKLGYREIGGHWAHSDRQAIFVGDLIDRGPGQVATVELVRRMVNAESAVCLLGNHEFNAIAWATRDPELEGEYLRRHGRHKNRIQHQAFLAEVEGTVRHVEYIEWFKTLPLWFEQDGLRAVHACWHPESMASLAPYLAQDNCLTDELIHWSSREGHWAFDAVERLCKGLEVDLPEGVSFHDNDGTERKRIRVRWWDPASLLTYRSAALESPEVKARIPDMAIPETEGLVAYQGPPLFIGHYWRQGNPKPLAGNIACVDYSAAEGGALVAYRWEGETELSAKQFVSVV